MIDAIQLLAIVIIVAIAGAGIFFALNRSSKKEN